MTTKNSKKLAAVIAALVIAVACAKGLPNPAAPSDTTNQTTVVVKTVSTTGLSAGALEILKASASASQIRRWANRSADMPIKVYSPFTTVATQWALDYWTVKTGLQFKLVDKPEDAEITISQEIPQNAEACGDGFPKGAPAINGGVIRVAYGVKTECTADLKNLQAHIAHELGHVLGFGHSPAKQDAMSSPALWATSAALEEAAKFIYTADVGATVK